MKLKEFIGEDWFIFLQGFLKTNFFDTLQKDLLKEITAKDSILEPSIEYVFEPFKSCRLKDLKVVILNDHPMKEVGVNDGLPFSISFDKVKDIPLDATYFWEGIELDSYDGLHLKLDYDYHKLAAQGVLMLNCSPTISMKEGNWIEHYEMWKKFTWYVLHTISKNNTGIVFITIGDKAREYIKGILKSNNYLLTTTHPRNVGNHFGRVWDSAGVFSVTNEILTLNNNTQINWL